MNRILFLTLITCIAGQSTIYAMQDEKVAQKPTKASTFVKQTTIETTRNKLRSLLINHPKKANLISADLKTLKQIEELQKEGANGHKLTQLGLAINGSPILINDLSEYPDYKYSRN